MNPTLAVIGSNVTVASGSVRSSNQPIRHVTVTPLLTGRQAVYRDYEIEKILLKAVCKVNGAKKSKNAGPKTFTLRSIDGNQVCSSKDLKGVIRTQLEDDIVDSDFEVGVIQGSNVVSIRTRDDMIDVWKDVKKGVKVVLWCNGLRPSICKRKRSPQNEDSDSDEEREPITKAKRSKKAEEREDKVHDILKQLKEKHGKSFLPMQLRIWSEMVAGEIHSSLDEPPSTSMFARAGNTPVKKKDQSGSINALTEIATAIASAFSPSSTNQSPIMSGKGSSPAKLIEGRSKCYKQLSELNNLKINGVINEQEYHTEKEAIMEVLSTLKGSR